MQLRLAVTTDHPDVGVNLEVVPLKEGESPLDTALDVVIGKWEWAPEDMEAFGEHVKYFILDPDLYKDVLNRIKWPEPWGAKCQGGLHYETEDAINRCKIRVYRACRIHWTHNRITEILHEHPHLQREIIKACA